MAEVNPLRRIKIKNGPFDLPDDFEYFVFEETEEKMTIGVHPDHLGGSFTIVKANLNWSRVEDDFEADAKEIADKPTFDRQMMLDFLVDNAQNWPNIHGAWLPNRVEKLPEPWTWVANPPENWLMAVNAQTSETITRDTWVEAAGKARKAAIQFLRENLETWPYMDPGERVGFADFSAFSGLPKNGLWEWQYEWQYEKKYDPNGDLPAREGFVFRQTKTGETITESDFIIPSVQAQRYFPFFEKLPDADVPGYESLREVLEAAYDQAARGKGKERHAQDLPFHEQRMQTISQMIRSERGMAYQVCKKVLEGLDLPTAEARRRELLGAINYIAGILIYWDQSENGARDDS